MRIDEVIVNEFGLDDIKQRYAGVKQGIKNFGNKRLANKEIKQAKPLAKKISNDFIALFTRLFMINNPQYIGFFKTKQMKRLVREPALFRTAALGDLFEGEKST